MSGQNTQAARSADPETVPARPMRYDIEGRFGYVFEYPFARGPLPPLPFVWANRIRQVTAELKRFGAIS